VTWTMTGRSSATVTKAEITDSATLNEQTEARTSSPDVPRSHVCTAVLSRRSTFRKLVS
jgi:hypothetical protein